MERAGIFNDQYPITDDQLSSSVIARPQSGEAISIKTPVEILPDIKKTPEVLSPGSSYDVNVSAKLYWQLESLYGVEKASKIALEIYTEDIRALSWEATDSPLPYRSLYRLVSENGATKMVHISDLHWQRDILEGVSPNYRDGLELLAVSSMKAAAIESPVGMSHVMISPKFDAETERPGRTYYTDTQVTILEKVDTDLVSMTQHQRRNLDRRGSGRFLNRVLGAEHFTDQSSIDEIMTSVISTTQDLSLEYMLTNLAELTGESIDYQKLENSKILEQQIHDRSRFQARRLLDSIKSGQTGELLEDSFAHILASTIGFENLNLQVSVSGEMILMTSCGGISFGRKKELRFGVLSGEVKGIPCPEESCSGVTVCPSENDPKCHKCKSPLPKEQVRKYLQKAA